MPRDAIDEDQQIILEEAYSRIEEVRKDGAISLDLSDLDRDVIRAVSASFDKLPHVQHLNLSGCNLARLPESIGRLTRLKRLYLRHNDLIEVPKVVGQLKQLEYLDLDSNHIRGGAKPLSQLPRLRALDLSGNGLSGVPQVIDRLEQLEELDLSENRLTEVPEFIGRLTQLEHLSLSSNELTELPRSIGRLVSIERLFIARNKLETVPDSIRALASIRVLSLGTNPLANLPEWIGDLENLEILDLASTGNIVHSWAPRGGWTIYSHGSDARSGELEALPQSLRRLRSLTELYLHGNDRLELPIEVLGPEWVDVIRSRSGARNGATTVVEEPAQASAILDYYFRVQHGRRPLNEAKLILVGRGAVGKTSIVNRLVHGQFQSNEKKTEGIQITDWKLQLEADEEVRLNIWDFGGQEIMHATHQFFLTQRSLYLVVLNGREGGEDADAEYWLKLIESFGDNSPVIVVLNKIKEHPFDLNRRGLHKKYPTIRRFIRTDCEDGTGIQELWEAIERETDRLEHLRDAFPANWFTIKDQLAEMKSNYLSFENYRELCKQHGESNDSAQEALAGYLHNLGIVLNYRDDPRLQDTHVLNAHWVTNGIYKILNSELLEQQKGEIRLDDITDILDARDYPASMRRFILDLMRKFDLCFSFPDDDTHYLIPELLDKEEPAEAAAFQPEECLNLQYHYTVLPEGLLPRFIVRSHVLSEVEPRWRTGVILQFDGSRALVKADVQDKKVFVSVAGSRSGRRQLLAIIRSDLQQIHRHIRNLQPQEMVPMPNYPNVVVPYQELQVMEQHGVRTFPKVTGEKVVQVEVQALLNGVDLVGTREGRERIDGYSNRAKLFYSYSHRDESFRNDLETHLKLLQRRGLIATWHDRKIEGGQDFKEQISKNLEDADIILLLISADFVASDYCYEIEMQRALERHAKGDARVVPIIVRDSNWKIAPFAHLQALPTDGRAITLWEDTDSAWRVVSEGIQRIAEQVLETRGW